jgi:hypothetical protein
LLSLITNSSKKYFASITKKTTFEQFYPMKKSFLIICLSLVYSNVQPLELIHKRRSNILKITTAAIVTTAAFYGVYKHFIQPWLSKKTTHVDTPQTITIVSPINEPGVDVYSYITQLTTLKQEVIRAGHTRFRTIEGETPLTLAALCKDYQAVETFLKLGAHPDEINCLLETPLGIAAFNGDSSIVNLLIKSGVNVNAPDRRSCNTPLMHAVQQKKYLVAKLLIEAGADQHITNYDIVNARMIAEDKGDEKMLRILDRKEITL